MIIARSPLRITLGGGGTDLPSYYREHEGFLIAAAIDKFVYVTIMRPFKLGIYLKYSQLEHVDEVAAVLHPIVREAIQSSLSWLGQECQSSLRHAGDAQSEQMGSAAHSIGASAAQGTRRIPPNSPQ